MATFRQHLRSRMVRTWTTARWHYYGIKGIHMSLFNKIRYLKNRRFYRRALNHSIPFRTRQGNDVHIIPEATLIIRQPREQEEHRPMVTVIIDGQRLYFYKSSGKRSRKPGKWFPTIGVMADGEKKNGRLVRAETVFNYLKLKEHFNEFPPEIEAISRRISELEKAGSIPLRYIGLHEQLRVQRKWDLWPHREREGEDGLMTLYPPHAEGH